MKLTMQMQAFRILTIILIMGTVCCTGQNTVATTNQRQIALALESQGKNAEAETAWRLILKSHPSNPEPYAHLGLLEARQGRYREAVPLYRRALALGPKVPGLRINLGLALFKNGELRQAIQEFKPLLISQPTGTPEAQRLTILLGMAHYGLNEYAEAIPYLKQAAALDIQNLSLRLTLAHSCLWSKQYQCVLDTYHEILALNAESAEADMLAGEVLDEMKDTTGAIQQFRAAVKANPREPDVHFGLGYLLWTQKQFAEAVSEFQAELTNNPKHLQSTLYLADAQLQLGHTEVAQSLLENALHIDPKLELAHLDLGIIFANTGHQEDALRELNIAAKLAPEDVSVHWRLARLYQSMGKKEEARAEFDKASNINKAVDRALVNKISGGHAKNAPDQ
jgi:tetratricopeptide (TPR) repeat protein